MDKLTEVLKVKTIEGYTHPNHLGLVNEIQDNVMLLENAKTVEPPVLLYDYLEGYLKRRALTISSAFIIAARLYLAQSHSSTTLRDFWFGSYIETNYNSSKGYSIKNILHLEQRISWFISRVTNEPMNPLSIDEIADISITLAWVEAYFESGFFPQDLTVMSPSSQTHKDMVNEVKHILLPTIDNFLVPALNNAKNRVEVFPKKDSEEYKSTVEPHIKIDNTLVYFKTSGSFDAKKIYGEYRRLKGTVLLYTDGNTKQKSYTAIMYYPRFDYWLSVEV